MFTEAAREAARASRTRKAMMKAELKACGEIEVFAVRRETFFSWEVRQFGGVILARGTECFDARAAAMAAGERARRAMQSSA